MSNQLNASLPIGAELVGDKKDFGWADALGGLRSEHWTLGAGWRHMSIDYDKGEGADRKLFDAAYDGPRTWVAYAW